MELNTLRKKLMVRASKSDGNILTLPPLPKRQVSPYVKLSRSDVFAARKQLKYLMAAHPDPRELIDILLEPGAMP